MAEDFIRYDILTQDALRGVVRKVLSEVASTGLPGDHHFYVSFETNAPGVRISSRLLADYPEEMTIVIQHQYWDLKVNEHSFEIGLSFGDIPEKLLIPFGALKGFLDPSVQFGLQFEKVRTPEDEEDGETETPAGGAVGQLPLAGAARPQAADDVSSSDDGAAPDAEGEPAGDEAGEGAPREAEVVSLDAFRKK